MQQWSYIQLHGVKHTCINSASSLNQRQAHTSGLKLIVVCEMQYMHIYIARCTIDTTIHLALHPTPQYHDVCTCVCMCVCMQKCMGTKSAIVSLKSLNHLEIKEPNVFWLSSIFHIIFNIPFRINARCTLVVYDDVHK